MADEHKCDQIGVIAELKANMRAAFIRIDEQRAQGEALMKLTDSMHVLAISVATMSEKVETIIKTVSKVESSVAKLEEIPMQDYRHYKRQWIGGAGLIVIGGIIGAILQLILV